MAAGQVVLASPDDFRQFLPKTLPQPFAGRDLATTASQPLYLAQKITCYLRKMGRLRARANGAERFYTLFPIREPGKLPDPIRGMLP